MSPLPMEVSLQTTKILPPEPAATCGGPELPGLSLRLITPSNELPPSSLARAYTSFENPSTGPALQTMYTLSPIAEISGQPESASSLLKLTESANVSPAFSLILTYTPRGESRHATYTLSPTAAI